MIRLFDRTLPTPEENLACDEALLEACEEGWEGAEGGVLRFYEAASPFVVVGYGNRVAAEADVQACDADGIPILRRASGGGTVLLGPGCLAYAIVLRIDDAPQLATITGTNRWIMERNRAAIESVVGQPVGIQGHTDLTLGSLKFSGNAQRRRRRAVLFHGTFLLSMDLGKVGRWLRQPSWEPAYRGGRGHGSFLVNLEVGGDAVRGALARVWEAGEPWGGGLEAAVARCVAERYGRREWNRRL